MKQKLNRLTAVLMTFVLLAVMLPSLTIPSKALTVDDITARADYLYNITWTAKKDVKIWNNRYTLKAGQSHRIPYGQPYSTGRYICWGISVDDFLAAANNASSEFYTKQSTGGGSSAYYSMDCSAFVSYCWHLSSRTTTRGWAGLNATNLGLCNSANVGKIRQGDALNEASSHIVLVSRVQNGIYEITEQTVPEMRRSYYNAAQLTAKYGKYSIYRNNAAGGVPARTYDDVSEGNYNIVNVGSGKYLNAFAKAGLAKANTNICASNGDGTAEQKYRIQSAGDKKYYIRCLSNNSQFCVNASSGSVVYDGANVHLWNYNDVPSKLWHFKYDNGAYIIYNAMNPNLVLTAAGYGHRDNVCVRAYTGSDLQKWRLVGDAPHSHSYNAAVTKEATCAENGVKTYTCSCGSSYTEDIPKKSHTAAALDGHAATCTESGLTSGTKCSVCGAVLQAQETVAPLGHAWESGFNVDKEATDTESGEKSRHCTRCGERKDITEIPKLESGQPEPPDEPVLYGDVNGDGEINIKDVVLLRVYLEEDTDSAQSDTVEIHVKEADVNVDGEVDIKDLILLRSYLEQMDDDTGVSPVVLGKTG